MLSHSSLGSPVHTRFNGSVSSELRRLFLELGPEEQRKLRVSELLQRSNAADCADCVACILDRLVNFPTAQALGLYGLYELLRLHSGTLLRQFPPARIYDLFHPNADEWGPCAFLHTFLCCKEAQSLSAAEEGAKLQRLLLRRSRQLDLRRVPASPARTWLCRIWLDIPSTRPDRQLLAGCCARWIGDANTPQADKVPCFMLMRLEREQRGLPEGDAWTVSVLLEQVCRDPSGHSPDLQHLLWPLGASLGPPLLKPLLHSLAQEPGRLVTLWVCLCLWTPQMQPQDLVLGSPPWPPDALPPVHMLLRALLTAFSQLPSSGTLCRTCLMTLAAVASSGAPGLATTSWDLLLTLHKSGPLLPHGAWTPLLPVLQASAVGQPAAQELLARLQRENGLPATPGPGPMVPYSSSSLSMPPPLPMGQPFATAHPLPMPVAQQGMVMPYGSVNGFHPPNGGLPDFGLSDFNTAPPAVGNNGFSQLDRDGVPIHFEPAHVGLQNTNNTCYMNSFIQSLFLTNRFVSRIFAFELHLKKNPSKVDKEDFEIGQKIVKMLQKQVAKMALTHHKHTDIWELLQVFPEIYRSGEQQDVTETIRFVFDMLGGYQQPLIREVFAGELSEKTMCQVCNSIKSRPETFSDLVLAVPKEKEVERSGIMPTTQALLDERLKFEYLDDDNMIFCESCQKKQRVAKWCEIVSPPAHLCICLSRFDYDPEAGGISKEKTRVQVDGTLQIGPFTYELYHVILHTGKTATSGHYYAIGRRSEPTADKPNSWVTMDDSQVKEADMNLLRGRATEKQNDDNPYVLFYRCQQAPPTPAAKIPAILHKTVKEEEAKVQMS